MPNPITTPGYRYATRKFEGDGVTVDFEFNFDGVDPGYISRDHVEVSIMDKANRVEVIIPKDTIVWMGPNQIRIPQAQPDTHQVIIRRDTPKENPLLDFTDGAILNETNLNMTSEQAVYVAAEMVDRFADLMDMFSGVNTDVIDSLNFALQALAIAQEARAYALQALAIAQAADDKATLAIANSLEAVATAEAAVSAANAALSAAQAAEANAAAALLAAEDAAQAALDAAASAAAAQAAVEAILAAAKRMEVALFADGRIQFNNDEVIRYLVVRAFSVDSGLSKAVLQVAPSANFIMSIFKNGIVIGTITFPIGTIVGTVNIPTAVTFNPDDILSISTFEGDLTAAKLSVTIAGNRI